jgi:hypothetical protein
MSSWLKIRPHTEIRDGPYGRRNWCLIHETWWKLCDCPGQANKTVTLTQDEVNRLRRDDVDGLGRPNHMDSGWWNCE